MRVDGCQKSLRLYVSRVARSTLYCQMEKYGTVNWMMIKQLKSMVHFEQSYHPTYIFDSVRYVTYAKFRFC